MRPRLFLLPALLAACTEEDADKTGTQTATGQGDSASPAPDLDGDGYTADDGDCDDEDPDVHPGALESCNGRDDDCDDAVDEDVLLPWWRDADGDGHGAGDPTEACEAPEGFVDSSDDCDDDDAGVSPSTEETCNGIDDDCDSDIDEGVLVEVFADTDGDGWGDAAAPDFGCEGDEGVSTAPGDCDDGDPYVHPGVVGDSCDGVDTDCDGDIDEDSKAGWTLLTVDTNAGSVFEIDTTTAVTTEITPLTGPERINSMDVSENGLSIVHTHNDPDAIRYFDPCTGSLTMIGEHGTSALGGIAFGPAGRLFGIGSDDMLVEFDLSTGLATPIGPLGIDIGTSGLAWDCTNQRMFGADGSGDRVFEVDLTTGRATNVRPTAVPFGSVGLEYDRASGLLYASTGRALYRIEPSTGASTLVGPLAAQNADDLAWHPVCP